MTPRRWPWRDDVPIGGRPVRRLRDSLTEVARNLRLDDPDVIGTVLTGWPGIVGETVAAHARPQTLREGVLVVEVDSPAWATQLRYLEETLIRRLGRRTRPGSIREVRVVVRRPGG